MCSQGFESWFLQARISNLVSSICPGTTVLDVLKSWVTNTMSEIVLVVEDRPCRSAGYSECWDETSRTAPGRSSCRGAPSADTSESFQRMHKKDVQELSTTLFTKVLSVSTSVGRTHSVCYGLRGGKHSRIVHSPCKTNVKNTNEYGFLVLC